MVEEPRITAAKNGSEPRTIRLWIDLKRSVVLVSCRVLRDPHHILVGHQLRHPLRMARLTWRVSVEDQFPAVFVSLPFGNHLHIDAFLDRARDEQVGAANAD